MKRKKTGDDKVDEMFRQVDEDLTAIQRTPVTRGASTSELLPNATSVLVKHRLGRKWQGWLVTNLEGATASGYIVHVPSTPTSPYDETKYVRLQANNYGATISVDIWVF